MIDEFQDTDHAQAQLLYLLADTAESVVAVGDDDQGIYRFRGASTKNIADFRARYPTRREIKLELNHRSTQSILDAAHAVVERVPERAEKRLVALEVGDRPGARTSGWRPTRTARRARWPTRSCASWTQGVPFEEQAILMDAVRTESPAIVRALEAAGIPHQVHGGLGLFERREVREVLAWLRAITDPSDAQAHLRLAADPTLALPWGATADAVATAAGAGVPITGALLARGGWRRDAVCHRAGRRGSGGDRPGRGLRARGPRPLWSAPPGAGAGRCRGRIAADGAGIAGTTGRRDRPP